MTSLKRLQLKAYHLAEEKYCSKSNLSLDCGTRIQLDINVLLLDSA